MTVESNETSRETEPVFTNPQKVYTTSEEPAVTAAAAAASEPAKSSAGAGDGGQGKYPKIVLLIILNELCERFSYYGIRTVLFIFLTDFLGLPENSATAIYHAFTVVCYFTPVIGAIISDGYIGLYRTILYVSCVYCCGNVILTLTSMGPLGAPNLAGPMVGLLIIAIGTGGIKPCVAAFGGNQFHSYQKGYLETFFSFFYLAINVGSTIGTILTPIFRNDVKCFGADCYPLAFGVPAVFMLISIVFFVIGTPFYRRDNDKVNGSGNVITQTIGCIFVALVNKIKSRTGRHRASSSSSTAAAAAVRREHWIDYADHKYSPKLIADVKAFCRVLLVFVPLPLFWAVYDQQGSRWTAQAQQLDGRIGASFTIKPDQFQAVNPILIIVLVPFFNFVVYPIMAKCGLLKRSLQRMGAGIIFAMLAFLIAAFLEWQMQKASARLNPAEQIRLLNLLPCRLELVDASRANSSTSSLVVAMDPPDLYHNQAYQLPDDYVRQILSGASSNTTFKLNGQCLDPQTNASYSLTGLDVQISAASPLSTVVFYSSSSTSSGQVSSVDTYNLPFSKSDSPIGSSEIRFLMFKLPGRLYPSLKNKITTYEWSRLNSYSLDTTSGPLAPSTPTPSALTTSALVTVAAFNETEDSNSTSVSNNATLVASLRRLDVKAASSGKSVYSKVDYADYTLIVMDENDQKQLEVADVLLETCGRYSVLLFASPTRSSLNASTLDYVILADVRPNGIHLGWQIVQIFVMTIGEIMTSISGITFAYSQAPASMKSVLQASYYLTVAIGNLIVVVVAEAKFVDNQVFEYLIFVGLLGVALVIFTVISVFYKYVEDDAQNSSSDDKKKEELPLDETERKYADFGEPEPGCSSAKAADNVNYGFLNAGFEKHLTEPNIQLLKMRPAGEN